MNYKEISQQLKQNQQQYLEVEVADSLPDKRKKFYFCGNFKQQKVLWEVNLYAADEQQLETLLQYYRLVHIQENVYRIDIHLAIEEIKQRDILMSMIMINKYKKLDIGEHKWYLK